MAKTGKPFLVDTKPTKEAVVDSLTRDISVEACLFDLIDNSIDAARNSIFAQAPEKSSDGLPDSYSGYKISIKFSGDGFAIEDNCGGIPVQQLKTVVLRFGQRSSHPMGIGIFGLGLNRALFKLGRVSHLKTDTGSQRAELILKTKDYLESPDWDLPAEEFKTSGKIGTSIEVIQLFEDIAQNFADKDWVDQYRQDVGRRYGRFIQKGLEITVNDMPAPDGEVQIRTDSPFPEEYKFYKTEGVTVHVRFGQHREHRFSAEPDYDKARNSSLTDQFGWTILCNDRAIVVSDKTMKTGWDTKFHTEFYGFVGVVAFDASDPSKLPWDTTKFDVDLNNRAYQTALIDMRKFAEKWRSIANRAKDAQRKGEKLQPTPASSKKAPSAPSGSSRKPGGSPANGKGGGDLATASKTRKQPTRKMDHNQFGTILPDDIDELHCFDKHLALVHEAKNLDLNLLVYSGMALLRCLFEATVVTYLGRHNRLDELKQFALTERQKTGHAVKSEKDLVPSFEEMLTFLVNNPSIWGAVKQNHLKHSLNRMVAQKKMLNSAIHNPWQPINRSEAFTIRDEVLPILRHLIET